ncbi:MAG: peptidylprolyl isomerase [Candidatus Zhuqueibacterota bacterium]
MAIMNKMRENTHIILFGLLVLFVLSMTVGGLVGGADITHLFGRRADTIATINGEDISYKQYSDYYQQQYEAYKQQYQRDPVGVELQNLEDQMWESLIREVLIRQKTDELGFVATKKEIAFHIFENPPQFIVQNPNFADEQGNFDMKKYQSALADQRNSNYWSFVENYLANTIPFSKLQQEVVSSAFVTDEEVKYDFMKRNQKVRVKHLFFDENKYKARNSEISQKEIEKYFDENTEKYTEQEKRRIQFVKFALVPTKNDSDEVMFQVEFIMDSLRAGIDFARMAEAYSEDAATASSGGDMGYIEPGTKDSKLENALFSANVGDVVGPIATQNGLHILKVTEKKKEDGKDKVKASQILFTIKPSRDTQESVRDNAGYFVEIANEQGFSVAVKDEKMTVDTTGYFTNSGFIQKLGMQRRISESIFHAKVGKITQPYFIENQGYVVCQLLGIQPEKKKELKDVESTIRDILAREKGKERAAEAAKRLRDRIPAGSQLEQYASYDSLKVEETEFFALTGYVKNVGRDVNFSGAAFALEVGEISPVVKGTRGAYIIQMIEKQPFDQATFDLQKENLKSSLLQDKQRRIYNNWYTDLKESAKIKDFRYMFF